MTTQTTIHTITLAIGITLLVAGLGRLLLTPLALWFEFRAWGRRRRGEPVPPGTLTMVVPCHNEGRVLEHCITSMVAALPPGADVVIVDDGSTDDTWAVAQGLAERFPVVRAIHQQNAGKGAALNTGIENSEGEFVMLTDADGIFAAESIREMLRGMADPRVGAVCGDDRTVNLDRVQTRFMTLISHVGTGFMRRVLATIHALPIVSGNVGCFRRSVLEEVGGLRTDTLGEDLELTWRIHEAGYRVVLRPRAIVYAESPSTLRGLWRQRVRWARGFYQTIGQHWRTIGNPRYGIFGVSLLPLVFANVVLPVLQLLILPLLVYLALTGVPDAFPGTVVSWLLWLSVPVALLLTVIACALDRALRDLRYLWTLPLWPFFSFWMSWVAVWGLVLELRGTQRSWQKLERTGVVSVGEAQNASGGVPTLEAAPPKRAQVPAASDSPNHVIRA